MNSNTGYSETIPTGRFAPSPSGRMHLGNIFTALISWLSVKARGGRWILRIEDLDPQRSRLGYARMIEEDLAWLGLDFDEGGLEGRGDHGPYLQSQRDSFYEEALERLKEAALTYPCTCTRADIMATQAPHQSDGRIVYSGRCRPADISRAWGPGSDSLRAATRLVVPDEDITFVDRVYGLQRVNLARHCGDFILRRADKAWAYMLAVVVDDAAMGVTEIVRGNDLLLSAAQQLYLYRLLGFPAPEYAHLPLIGNAGGRRLSKRDEAMSMEQLRRRFTPEELVGRLAFMANIIPDPQPCTPQSLIGYFDWNKIPRIAMLQDTGQEPR